MFQILKEFGDYALLPEGVNLESAHDRLKQQHAEISNTATTLLLLVLLIPEAVVFLVHFFKSLFGSQPWPTMRIVLMVSFAQPPCVKEIC